MKVRLTLQEKLRDLRDEKKLTLSALSEVTSIPTATLQRLEANEDSHASYTDVAALAKFYDVSADYLFGLTDNRQHRNVEIDTLRISDAAIEVLKEGKMNNRLISEILAHEDFFTLLSSMEIYVDRKVIPQMNAMNQMYKLAEETIKSQGLAENGDEILALLQQTVVNEDEYLRYRISERFNILMKKLFDAHKKDVLPDTQQDILKEYKEGLQNYLADKETQSAGKAKLILLGKQIGLNMNDLTNEEVNAVIKALQKSQTYKKYHNKVSLSARNLTDTVFGLSVGHPIFSSPNSSPHFYGSVNIITYRPIEFNKFTKRKTAAMEKSHNDCFSEKNSNVKRMISYQISKSASITRSKGLGADTPYSLLG